MQSSAIEAVVELVAVGQAVRGCLGSVAVEAAQEVNTPDHY